MLTEEEKAQLMPKFEAIASVNQMEVEDVIEQFNDCLESIEMLPKMKNKSRRVKLNRANSMLTNILDNRKTKGEPFVFLLFGPLGDPRDWNSDYFASIDAEVERGNIKGLMKEGKIMTMVGPDGKEIPVSHIDSFETKKVYVNTETDEVFDEPAEGLEEVDIWVVNAGTPWTKGQELIYRDARPTLFNRINYAYGKPLRHRWDLQLEGVGFPKDSENDVRLITIHVRGDEADINSDSFIMKKMDPFKPYELNAEIVEKKTTKWRYVLEASKVNVVAWDEIEDVDIYIEELLESLIEQNGMQPDIPDFLDGYSMLEEFHSGVDSEGNFSELFLGVVQRNDKGEIMRTPGGYEKRNWQKYAIMRVDVSGIGKTKSGTRWYYYLTDSTMPNRLVAWASDYIMKQPKIPGPCLAMITTRRSKSRYDAKTRQRVDDLEHGDINVTISTITGLEGGDIEIGEI